jgi:hypothetical protein
MGSLSITNPQCGDDDQEILSFGQLDPKLAIIDKTVG